MAYDALYVLVPVCLCNVISCHCLLAHCVPLAFLCPGSFFLPEEFGFSTFLENIFEFCELYSVFLFSSSEIHHFFRYVNFIIFNHCLNLAVFKSSREMEMERKNKRACEFCHHCPSYLSSLIFDFLYAKQVVFTE